MWEVEIVWTCNMMYCSCCLFLSFPSERYLLIFLFILRILITTVLGWTTALVGGIIVISSYSYFLSQPTSWTYLALAWFMSCTTNRSWTRQVLLLRILYLAQVCHRNAQHIMELSNTKHIIGIDFPVSYDRGFSFCDFLDNPHQYGCDVCGWPVFCPSRWSDWVSHSAGGSRSNHKWTGTYQRWLCKSRSASLR